MPRRLNVFFRALKFFFKRPYYGFIQGHRHLTYSQISRIKEAVSQKCDETELEYEKKFAEIIGQGRAVCFANGRAGFYLLMKMLNVAAGDEIIIPASTCSVMVNAILRTGAKPVYSDIDLDTFSSSLSDIEKVISNRTKMIVAQHSFGIPSNILPIVKFAKERGIFLLEDCALTVGSKINQITCGNFGDAALFSTDHSKPINTIVGGLIYTKNSKVYKFLKNAQSQIHHMNNKKQKALWHQFKLERFLFNPNRYGMHYAFQKLSIMLGLTRDAFNNEDYSSMIFNTQNYLIRMPLFLIILGLFELNNWHNISKQRERNLKLLIKTIKSDSTINIPSCYEDSKRVIVPLRLAWLSSELGFNKFDMFSLVYTDGVWFKMPVVSTNEPMINFKYKENQCLKAEKMFKEIENLPCNLTNEDTLQLAKDLLRVHSSVSVR